MLTELLKMTAIWGLLLLFYFAFLSKEKAPVHNRLFLWLSLCLGMIIPFLSVPGFIHFSATENPIEVLPFIEPTTTGNPGGEITQSPASFFRLTDWLFYLWLSGAVIQIFIVLKNAFQLYRLKKGSILKQHEIADYYACDNISSAFSFGKAIFLPAKHYDAEALRFILKHEKDHEQYRHWLDNSILALLQVVFWFHPFFYLFKNELKLNHEYQVDANVNHADNYAYARLLLTQNQNNYRKSFVHTFHYSPLKKRIAMMTKEKKSHNWKYLLALPLVASCMLFMSADQNSLNRINKGDITKFKGNTIEWKEISDTIIYRSLNSADPQKTVVKHRRIIKCNGQPVTQALDYASNKFVNPEIVEIGNNISQALLERKNDFPEQIQSVQILNLVLDKNFKVYYYDVQTIETDTVIKGQKFLTNEYPEVNALVDKILTNENLVNPNNLQSDKPFYVSLTKADFEPITLEIKLLNE